ncbi:MAG: hypothetical protein IPM29_25845 [Planctomycetes bacterium]|nr:hypothetical protein [Planctomycetota bacterium]
MLAQVTRRLGLRRDERCFQATHQRAELDLLIVRGRHRDGFECAEAPDVTPSMRITMRDLRLDELVAVPGGEE